MTAFALVPAAGKGERLAAGRRKQYLDLAGRPMLYHTCSALLRTTRIDSVFLCLAPDDTEFQPALLADCEARVRVLRCGGSTRAETVGNALASMADQCSAEDWVLVHDAARPCLSREALLRLLAADEDAVGALLALPVADTVKRGSTHDRVTATLPRDGLWMAQTPQMFRLGLLRRALAAAGRAGQTVTDESSAIEALGLQPRLVLGDPRNIKVTWPGDIELAERMLHLPEV